MTNFDDTDYGYCAALKAAGAQILLWKEFGSYSGRWVAKVRIGDRLAWVSDYYGSCSGCDDFEANFGWKVEEGSEEYQKKLVDFGKRYLENLLTQEQLEKEFAESAEWSLEDERALVWIRSNAIGGSGNA